MKKAYIILQHWFRSHLCDSCAYIYEIWRLKSIAKKTKSTIFETGTTSTSTQQILRCTIVLCMCVFSRIHTQKAFFREKMQRRAVYSQRVGNTGCYNTHFVFRDRKNPKVMCRNCNATRAHRHADSSEIN